ncbi:Gfo/Idh/MocA family oxidoreductase [uncultured Thiohalocapsa sp.]|uniref:Gfo/Idh/MocA family protein n=1 Tax=uncultured Thiohalocapsa sp. TaxID=768990 RepID=UPI0025F2F26F|nr:Gfo/Idh/MocA family oxidoreductase [uncultured Thiohalocapsa sp.]
MTEATLRIGIAGLGGAGGKVLPLLAGDALDGLVLGAAADLRPEARDAFEQTYGRPAYASVEALCRAPDLDLIYVATPSPLHCANTLTALAAGKHVLCEKPLATSLDDCDRMIAAARAAGLLLVQGHSKVFDAPVHAMRALIASGRLGRVFQVDCWNCNDWMRRPRLPAELDTEAGGGVVLRQAPQLVDLVRVLIGRAPRTVRAVTGRHAPGLDTEGNFAALIGFDGGAAATIAFNGYGHLSLGPLLAPGAAASVRATRTGPVGAAEKYAGGLAAAAGPRRAPTNELALVSGEQGVLVAAPTGLTLHANGVAEPLSVPDTAGRAAGFIELRDALREGRPGFPDGSWARTTLEVCLAILESARLGAEVPVRSAQPAIPEEHRP